MPRAWRDVALFALGAAAGYVVAVATRAAETPALFQIRHYVLTHRNEALLFLLMAGLIIYLAGTPARSGRR